MNKPLLYRLMGIGRVPPVRRETLEDEGFVILDEGITITVDYRGYQVPGRSFSRKERSVRGAVVVTRRRFIAFARFRKILSVRLDDPRLATLALGLESPTVLTVTVDPSAFHADRTGEVVYRFHTDYAPKILAILEGCRQG